jgi:predicted transcriptional regulator/transcriptional regulator with XRE-family HTH domain
MTTHSIFIGGKIKKLRRDKNINQKTLASDLGISASYLNLIERNRRGLTVDLLLKLAGLFEIDITELSQQNDAHIASDLMEVFGDILFADFDMTNKDIQDLATENPEIGKAFIRLYDKYQADLKPSSIKDSSLNHGGLKNTTASPSKPNEYMSDLTSDFLQEHNNYFPSLEDAAERIRSDLNLTHDDLFQSLKSFAHNTFGLRVRSAELPENQPYNFNEDYNMLVISNYLPQSSRIFILAKYIATLATQMEIEKIIVDQYFEDPEIEIFLKAILARYVAGAIIMPYDEILNHAKKTRYDIDLLSRLFGCSFEQVCHRLTTLQRAGSKGIAFHFIRTDIAGNISKRFSTSGIQIPRYGGACPRWNIYSAFMQSGQINTQISEMPDGQVYFCIARSFTKGLRRFGAPVRHFSIGLGCKFTHAKSLVYSDGIDLKNSEQIVPIGVNCRICPRKNCSERAFPTSIK